MDIYDHEEAPEHRAARQRTDEERAALEPTEAELTGFRMVLDIEPDGYEP